ncbi:MAG TPA: cytochrome c [Prolixibacteraceae bacterium]|jgi:mono/diheme cytochrome c family protein
MRKIKNYQFLLLFVSVLFLTGSCKKDLGTSGTLYTPTTADVTSTATLAELQQGRVLYSNNCASCHGLYMPDSYSPAQWRSVMGSMAPRTGMSSSQVLLVTKYVTKGK